MIFVDSSVWIDYFRDTSTPEADRLDALLGEAELLTGDVVLVEVLQGFASERDFRTALDLFDRLAIVDVGGRDAAIEAARLFRTLRAKGITVRKTIDTLIAAWCIRNEVALLSSDRDFYPFVAHIGLKSAMAN